MPEPKNNPRPSDATPLPDVGFEPIGEEIILETVVFVPEEELGPRVHADGHVPAAAGLREARSTGRAGKAMAKFERLEAKSPWLAIGVAVAFGWLVARMLRR